MANTKKIRSGLDVAGALTASGNFVLGGNISVAGTASFPGGIIGNVTMANNLTVTGDLAVTGSFSFAGGSVFPDDTFAVQDQGDATKQFKLELSGMGTGKTLTLIGDLTDNRSISFPDATCRLLGVDTVQTITNKIISAGNNTISGLMDTNIAALAGISMSKLFALTANRAIASDASGFLVASATTDAQLGFLSGVAAAVVDISSAQTLTNKSIDALSNPITNIADANIGGGAAIARSKIAAGTANHVVINSAGGLLSSEAQLSPARGGTGVDLSAATGVLAAVAGVVSARTLFDADLDAAAAISRAKLAAGSANAVLINDGGGVVSSEARLAPVRGGTGQDFSASTGLIIATAGTFSALATLNEARGGTNQTTYAKGDQLQASGTNTLSKFAIGLPGQVQKTGDNGLVVWEAQNNPSMEMKMYEEWISDGAGTNRWLEYTLGAGATSNTLAAASDLNHPGVLQLQTGTTATGANSRWLGGTAGVGATAGVVVGGGQMAFETLVQVPTLSTVAQEFTARIGLLDNQATVANEITFIYDRLNLGTNWQARCTSASTSTNLDTGVAVTAGSWIKLRAVIAANGASVEFFVNGSSIGTTTTNIPSVLIAPANRVQKTAGTTTRTFWTDYYKIAQRLTTAR